MLICGPKVFEQQIKVSSKKHFLYAVVSRSLQQPPKGCDILSSEFMVKVGLERGRHGFSSVSCSLLYRFCHPKHTHTHTQTNHKTRAHTHTHKPQNAHTHTHTHTHAHTNYKKNTHAQATHPLKSSDSVYRSTVTHSHQQTNPHRCVS